MAISRTKNGGKQSFNAPFSASHLEKTRISASDFASQSRTNEKPPVVRRGNPKRIQNRQAFHCGNPKRIQNRQSSAAATQNVCRTAGHLSLVQLGIHPGHYRRMSGGNSYVFEISGGNSHTIQQIPSRKRMQIRHSFSNERRTAGHSERQDGRTHAEPPIIRSERQDECMQNRHSFSDEKNRQSSRNTQASGRQLPAANSR